MNQWAILIPVVFLSSCGSPRPQPTELGPIKVAQEFQQLWTANLGRSVNLLQMIANVNGKIAFASDSGVVAVIDSSSGKELFRTQLPVKISAAMGFEGKRLALVSQNNELIVLEEGAIKWRFTLEAQVYTAPLVAGERVFVLLANRTIQSFDGATGRVLWTQKRTGETLVLQQQGVLMPFQNTLVTGYSGRLAALNPDTGVSLWETTLAVPRGINDLERLVDLVGRASRQGDSICVRVFQAQVGCVNARRGEFLWARPSVGIQGIDGNADVLFTTESNGVVLAWDRKNGERIWDTDRLKYRNLTAPLFTPKAIVIGDNGGNIYLLSPKDGSLLNRIQTKSDGFASPPTSIDNGFVILTASGNLLAYRLP
ncbi:MAG: outer membrane protein assembly factor BamB [Limnohabitans sp.]|nr:outer membrane protein assembly factor BamB [Limnohabitans sp.]